MILCEQIIIFPVKIDVIGFVYFEMSRPKSDKRKNSSNGSNKETLQTSRIANEKIWYSVIF